MEGKAPSDDNITGEDYITKEVDTLISSAFFSGYSAAERRRERKPSAVCRMIIIRSGMRQRDVCISKCGL